MSYVANLPDLRAAANISRRDQELAAYGLRGEVGRLARFSLRYPDSWNTLSRGNPAKTKRAMLRLEEIGLVQIARYSPALRPAGNMFRLRLPGGAKHAWPTDLEAGV